MKIVCQLDADGYFVGLTVADESPREPGVYLLPGGALDVAAPVIPDGKRARWVGEWAIEDIPEPDIEPTQEPEPDPVSQLTSLEFFDLFTEAEQLTIATAAMESAQVKLWYDRMLAASFITLEDPRTEAGLSALVAAEMLTAERKAEIVEAMQ